MKKFFLSVLSGCMIASITGQDIVREHYTVSGGLSGAANFTKFNVTGPSSSGIKYNTETGFSAGAWVNFPIGDFFSFEPQIMFSSYSYQSDNTSSLLIGDGEINYLSVPIALKLHAGDKIAITAGPQFDFLKSIEDDVTTNTITRKNFKTASSSVFGGLELFPHGRVTVFARYIHGLTNLNNEDFHRNGLEYRNRNIQAGLKLKLFGKMVEADSDGDGVIDKNDKCPDEFGLGRYDGCPIPDTDKDGINDENDKCPNQPGTVKYNGCPVPDTDKDGINDENDKCPNQPGTAKYNGCPIPDSDGDGINDEQDKCPGQAGPASRNGCPVTDRDNDGIDDESDKCPDVAGSKPNNGCPDVPADITKLLVTSAQSITYLSNSPKLSSATNSALNNVITVLNQHPEMRLRIEGHADNMERNPEMVSQRRAEAVKAWLVSKGIREGRIEIEGLSSTKPIMDNDTPANRAKNRRVELKIVY
jgi:outer membrane protein OmpA-like peptidoglycan-associated protein